MVRTTPRHVDTSGSEGAYRLRYPKEEKNHPWLSQLLDAYAVIDASVAGAVCKDGRPPACRKGCDICCHHIIPLTPLEAMGIRWFLRSAKTASGAAKKSEAPSTHLAATPPSPDGNAPAFPGPCPMLEHGACSVYPLRPIACRRYMVFGVSCLPGENCSATRPGDILKPSRAALEDALMCTRPFYETRGLWKGDSNDVSVFFRNLTTEIRQLAWEGR